MPDVAPPTIKLVFDSKWCSVCSHPSLQCRTSLYGLKVLTELAPVPDDVVREVYATVMVGRPYLCKIDRAYAKLVIPMPGRSYLRLVSHSYTRSVILVSDWHAAPG
ncbi:hypothetical protein B296_00007948 [Ensete ventricosum]|uniref:Uncharacterized protein n=1 Tax=Ensete ventricosum TaxID=4639 RepID=A0A426ZG09_ENSVE|nr:hypothetical protein B296_00007948 [Ensete ventricosum]